MVEELLVAVTPENSGVIERLSKKRDHRANQIKRALPRIADLLAQIEALKPNIFSADPNVQIRASEEIRKLNELINATEDQINKREMRPKPKPKSTLKKIKANKIKPQIQNPNMFRPG